MALPGLSFHCIPRCVPFQTPHAPILPAGELLSFRSVPESRRHFTRSPAKALINRGGPDRFPNKKQSPRRCKPLVLFPGFSLYLYHQHYDIMNKNKYQAEADRIAREHLYDRADFVGEWESYTVYISSMDGDVVHIIGFPYFFLFDAAGKCRVVMMQPGVEKEWYSLMDMASRLFDADEI
jgi:hypothetical protein